MDRRKQRLVVGITFALMSAVIVLSGVTVMGVFENIHWPVLAVVACSCALWVIARWAKGQIDAERINPPGSNPH